MGKYEGIHYNKFNDSWRATVKVSGKLKFLGLYTTKEAAYQARQRFLNENKVAEG